MESYVNWSFLCIGQNLAIVLSVWVPVTWSSLYRWKGDRSWILEPLRLPPVLLAVLGATELDCWYIFSDRARVSLAGVHAGIPVEF